MEASKPHVLESNPKILVDGRVPHFSRRLVGALRAHGYAVEQLPYLRLSTAFVWVVKLFSSDAQVVHLLQGHYPIFAYWLPMLAGKKLVVHWIGTDVATEVKRSGSLMGRFRLRVLSKASAHLTDFEALQKELARLPITARIVPLLPLPEEEFPVEWPDQAGVLSYVPEARADFYGIDALIALAESAPAVAFHVTAHSGEGLRAPPNMHFHGWVDDMESLWSKCRILVRLTEHDGLSHSVVEALLRGRYVLWTQPFPFCAHASAGADLPALLREILERGQPNAAAADFVRKSYGRQANLKAICEVYLLKKTSGAEQ